MRSMDEIAAITPILDSGVLPPPRPKKRMLGLIIGFGVGILFAAAIENAATKSQSGLALLFYFPIIALVVTLHESGHLAAGWLVGFHFSSISLGPFSLKIEYGRFEVRFRNDLGALGYAGMYIETVRRVRRNLLIFVAAGPATNLVSGAIAALFVQLASPRLRATWGVPFAAGFSVMSFAIAVLSLIPYGATLRSDGAHIWMLLKSREGARRWIASCALLSQQRKGIRSRNWKETWLKAACAVRDGKSDELHGNLLAYIAAADRKEVVLAAMHLERCLELARSQHPMQRNFLAREAAYFCAWFRSNASVAESWLSQVEGPDHATQLTLIRMSIALDCACHNFENAIAGWQKGAEFNRTVARHQHETAATRLVARVERGLPTKTSLEGDCVGHVAQSKAVSFWLTAKTLPSFARQAGRSARPTTSKLIRIQQHAFGFFGVDWAVE